jgi:zinc protease
VNITYLVGSRHEGYGETGMAHLLEHLVFKGTPRHPNIPQELTERGASPNGTTWYDRTNYFETFAATEDNLEWALDLEADRMVNSFIAAEDLSSEMTVVRNEFESGENSPFRVLLQRMMSSMYLWHNYGKSTIGARADLENVPIERLQAFYRKYYQPDNAILVVAGRFDEERVRGMIEETFGVIPRPDRTGEMRIWPTYTLDPVQDGERSVTLQRVGDQQMAAAGYHVAPGSHEDWAALDLLSFILTDAPSGRLHEALVASGQATSVSGLAFQLKEPSPFLLMANVRTEDSLDQAQATLLRSSMSCVNGR